MTVEEVDNLNHKLWRLRKQIREHRNGQNSFLQSWIGNKYISPTRQLLYCRWEIKQTKQKLNEAQALS